MDRRGFLKVSGMVGAATVISGCVDSGPEMEFQTFVVPDPVNISVDQSENEYHATIENRGDDGSVRAELWYFKNQDVPNPENPSMYQRNHQNMEFDLARSFYFSSDERREISITSNNQPEEWLNREFGIMAWPSSHGAVFENNGDAGEIESRLEYRDTAGYSVEEPLKKIESVGAGETIELIFDVVIPPRVEYEIIAETR